jgi:type IV pilus assembly protein PilE
MERYFTVNNTYVGATVGTGAATDVWGSTISPDGFYELSLSPKPPAPAAPPTATQYTVFAFARGTQVRDTACATLTVNQAGVKAPADCW